MRRTTPDAGPRISRTMCSSSAFPARFSSARRRALARSWTGAGWPRVFILDFSAVPLIDSTAAKALHGFVHKLTRSGTRIYFSGARTGVQRTLIAAGLKSPAVLYSDSVEAARVAAQEISG